MPQVGQVTDWLGQEEQTRLGLGYGMLGAPGLARGEVGSLAGLQPLGHGGAGLRQAGRLGGKLGLTHPDSSGERRRRQHEPRPGLLGVPGAAGWAQKCNVQFCFP